METTNVEEIVTQRFAEIMNLPAEKLNLDADLFAEYGLTSVNALKLISQVEVEFDIDIDEDEARRIQKLNDVIDLIKSKTT
jgi:acyl carrier protein